MLPNSCLFLRFPKTISSQLPAFYDPGYIFRPILLQDHSLLLQANWVAERSTPELEGRHRYQRVPGRVLWDRNHKLGLPWEKASYEVDRNFKILFAGGKQNP